MVKSYMTSWDETVLNKQQINLLKEKKNQHPVSNFLVKKSESELDMKYLHLLFLQTIII